MENNVVSFYSQEIMNRLRQQNDLVRITAFLTNELKLNVSQITISQNNGKLTINILADYRS